MLNNKAKVNALLLIQQATREDWLSLPAKEADSRIRNKAKEAGIEDTTVDDFVKLVMHGIMNSY